MLKPKEPGQRPRAARGIQKQRNPEEGSTVRLQAHRRRAVLMHKAHAGSLQTGKRKLDQEDDPTTHIVTGATAPCPL